MTKEVNLDGIILSEAAVVAWHEMAGKVAIALQHIGKMREKIISVPDERVKVNDNGTLTIFVNIPDVIDISMDVPADHWSYQH
jgi:hypothetical protein